MATSTSESGRPQPASDSEPFPALDSNDTPSNLKPATPAPGITGNSSEVGRQQSITSNISGRLRSASKKFEESTLPAGMWAATGNIGSSIPTLTDIRRGSFSNDGWSGEGQLKDREHRSSIARRNSQLSEKQIRRTSSGLSSPSRRNTRSTQDHPSDRLQEEEVQGSGEKGEYGRTVGSSAEQKISAPGETVPVIAEERNYTGEQHDSNRSDGGKEDPASAMLSDRYKTTPFDNGYQFPPKHTWIESTVIGSKALWSFSLTPLGFCVVIYGLNVVAWGGMIFLLLCNAAPAMCAPSCNDINSPRRVWIEIDSQVLTALFSVTGLGLIPWRFRDLYYLMKYRLKGDQQALQRLGGIYRGWFRLEGSQELPIDLGPADVETRVNDFPAHIIPYPPKLISDSPLTGVRAPPTALWKVDFVVWSMIWNTIFQIVLSGLMWGLSRYDRPSWSTGVFVALACIVAGMGGIMIFAEGNRVKAVEGVAVSTRDLERLRADEEKGILHYNNMGDKAPKKPKEPNEEKKEKKEKSGHGVLGKSHKSEGEKSSESSV